MEGLVVNLRPNSRLALVGGFHRFRIHESLGRRAMYFTVTALDPQWEAAVAGCLGRKDPANWPEAMCLGLMDVLNALPSWCPNVRAFIAKAKLRRWKRVVAEIEARERGESA